MNELPGSTPLSFVIALFLEEIPLFESHLPALTACDKRIIIITRRKRGGHQDVMKAIIFRVGFQKTSGKPLGSSKILGKQEIESLPDILFEFFSSLRPVL